MEKNIYEYEAYTAYMPANSNEGESTTEQFLVVQNDGTFLFNHPVQYVTEVNEVKDVLENVQQAVYDVGGQQHEQYYVNDVISVGDELVLPQDGSGNAVGNTFLFNDLETVQTNEMVAITHIDQGNTDENTTQISDNTNLTEVTLSDEQYNILQEKGWFLLESNDKVYLLNKFGLHDITGNEKLIQGLKLDAKMEHGKISTEIQWNGDEQNSSCTLAHQIVPKNIALDQENVEEDKKGNLVYFVEEEPKENIVHFVEEKPVHEDPTAMMEKIIDPEKRPLPSFNIQSISKETQENLKGDATPQNNLENQSQRKPCMVKLIKLKSKFSLNDIPNELVLGKTKNGKKLVAKVVNVKGPTQVDFCEDNTIKKPPDDDNAMATTETDQEPRPEIYYKAAEVERLIKKCTNSSNVKQLTCTAEDVCAAENIVKQLLNVEGTRAPLIGRQLCITRIVQQLDETRTVQSESSITLVTGRVTQFDGDDPEWHFVYVPHLLQRLKHCESDGLDTPSSGVNKLREDYMLHLHVVETKCTNEPTKTSITFAKRRSPGSGKKEVHACGACAEIFNSKSQLKQHQQAHCMEVDDEKPPLIIDTEKKGKRYIIKKIQGTKKTVCEHCNETVKTSNFKRHLQSHFGPDDSSGEENFTTGAKYKCKMCPGLYFHSSSLSKHVMGKHIKEKIN